LIAARREGKEESTESKDGVYWLERFEYIKESDSWRCPSGRLLVREKKQVLHGRPLLRRYECFDCEVCLFRRHCLKPGEQRRTLLVKRKQLIRAEMRARLKQPENRRFYRKRKWVLNRFSVRLRVDWDFEISPCETGSCTCPMALCLCRAQRNEGGEAYYFTERERTALASYVNSRRPTFQGHIPYFFSFSLITVF